MIKRNIETKLREAAARYPVLSLTGPRQSGKTTLLKHVFPDYRYVSLENTDMRDFATEDPKGFLEMFSSYVILDEAQRVPSLFSHIQTLVDETKIPGQFILSGSQNFLLSASISQSLAGRVGIFKLLPFSVQELKNAGKLPDLNSLLFRGLFPPVYDRDFPAGEWVEDYIETYLERDVRQLKHISNLTLFKRFLRLCAVRSGQILNLSNLGNDCGVSHNTVRDWISVLEASFILFLLPPYSDHLSRRSIKSPKLYFTDPGLMAALVGISSEEDIALHPYRGAIFETLMVTEFMKHFFNQKKPFTGLFWRDRDQHEIDLIFEDKKTTTLTAIEIKSSSTITADFFKPLTYFCSKNSDIRVNPLVIYGGLEEQRRTQARVLPWKDAIEGIFPL